MALFNKKDLSDYRERVELKLSVLPISPVLSEVQKETITTLYLQLIAILDEAIVTEIEVIEYQEI
jgi:hypothetical protein